jgi:hypothetical protein
MHWHNEKSDTHAKKLVVLIRIGVNADPDLVFLSQCGSGSRDSSQ